MPAYLRHLFRLVLRRPPVPLRVVVLLAAILAYGTTGFLYFELPEHPNLQWGDGLWYSLVTIATVGYGDLSPTTLGGRFIVALPLMFLGIGMLGYALSVAASALIEAKNKELHGMGTFRLRDHLVIVNFSDLGKMERVLVELSGHERFQDREVVLVDEDLPELPPSLAARGIHLVRGNPTRDETLDRAGIDTAAHALVLSKRPGDPHTDGLNVSVALAIEARAPRVFSVVECADPASQELMRKAGADRVVCASRFDAHFLTHELINPGIQEIVEQLTSNQRGQQLFLTAWKEPAPYSRVADSCRQRGHLPLGVRTGERTLLNPPADLTVQAGDRVITIGASGLD